MTTTKKTEGDVASWLASLDWELTHSDPGGIVENSIGRKEIIEPTYSARKNGKAFDITLPSMEQLLAAINEWEATQRPA